MTPNLRTLAALMVGLALSPWAATAPAAAADAKKEPARTAPSAAPAGSLTAEQIVSRNIAARGGQQAWKAVQTLQFTGKVEAGKPDSVDRSNALMAQEKMYRGKLPAGRPENEAQVQLPFTLDVKRPHKSRMEVTFAGKTAWQVYDGEHGWKFRPFLNRNDVEPFTADEAKSERFQDAMEGPLFDYAAKGSKVSLEKREAVDGSDAYKLKLVARDGSTRYVWVDARTFLDVKVQGVPRRMDGKLHDVYVAQRDFRQVQGVMLPFVIETSVDGYPDRHKMLIDNAAVNPKLEDALFEKPRA